MLSQRLCSDPRGNTGPAASAQRPLSAPHPSYFEALEVTASWSEAERKALELLEDGSAAARGGWPKRACVRRSSRPAAWPADRGPEARSSLSGLAPKLPGAKDRGRESGGKIAAQVKPGPSYGLRRTCRRPSVQLRLRQAARSSA